MLQFPSLKDKLVFSQGPPGTLSTVYDRTRPKVEPDTIRGVDSGCVVLYDQIVCADTLRAWSPEELRLVDYRDKRIPLQFRRGH